MNEYFVFFVEPFALNSLEIAWKSYCATFASCKRAISFAVATWKLPVQSIIKRRWFVDGNSLSVIFYCGDRHVQTFLSICYSKRVVLCEDTTVGNCFSCSCSISEVKFSIELLTYLVQYSVGECDLSIRHSA